MIVVCFIFGNPDVTTQQYVRSSKEGAIFVYSRDRVNASPDCANKYRIPSETTTVDERHCLQQLCEENYGSCWTCVFARHVVDNADESWLHAQYQQALRTYVV